MRPTDLEALVPGLREARATEHLNRALCFAGISWTIAGFELVPMIPRHRLELQLAQNPFFVGGKIPNNADVFQVVWRMNPDFVRKIKSLWVLLAKAALKRKTLRMTRTVNLTASLAISDHLRAMTQDLPEGMDGERNSTYPPERYVHWMAGEMGFFLRNFQGFTPETYLDTPYLILQQLNRAYRLAKENHPDFINESDKLAGRWIKQNVKAK